MTFTEHEEKKRFEPRNRAKPGHARTEPELRWLQIMASIASLIGLISLFALMTQTAHAANNGFTPGAKPFPSPFGNNPQAAPGNTAPNGNFFDEDQEDEGFNGAPNANNANPNANAANNPGAPRTVPPRFNQPGPGTPPGMRPTNMISQAPQGAPAFQSQNMPMQNSVSAGGTSPDGVIPNASIRAIQVDSDTGEGSKEMVTDFNFPDADIMDIAKTLGKLTGKNFILDKDVKGRITIISNGPITVSDAWKAFLTALDVNQFALIPSGKFIRIARQRDARDKQIRTYTGDYSPDTDALITRVFPLRYIDAEEVARAFRSFMPANSRIIPYEQTNTVIVTDTGSNIAKLNKMLEILDVEGYDVGIEVIPVRFASASELSKLIDTLIPGTSTTAAAGGAPRPMGATNGTRFSARRTKEGGVINTIIADERTNTLIVNANSKGADQVRELVAKLDQKLPAQVGGGKVHVVYLQFAEAEALATTLNNLSQAGTGGAGFHPTTPGGATGTGTNPVQASLFEGTIKISPDKSTNALVVNASPADFATVQRVIYRLDIPRDEVFVECVIMEIALNKQFDYSSNIISPINGIGMQTNQDLATFATNPLGLTGMLLGFKSTGQTTVTINGTQQTVSNVQGLIRAIQSTAKSNVLATPQIIALDNTEASFESDEKIPVPTTTQVQGAGVSTSVTKESVALSITIKPQINKVSNFVKMDVQAKLGNIENRVLPKAVADSAFATQERTAKTTVVVGDADTVVIGGLMRDNISDTVSKIPLLGDIPILGWLFSAKSSTVEKTNLLIFLTPHIVRQYETVRKILDKKLRDRDQFIEKNMGGADPLRDERDDLIRGLPDLKELMSRKPQTTVSIDEDEPQQQQQQNERPVRSQTPFTGAKQEQAPEPQQQVAPAIPADTTPPPPPVTQ